MGVPKRNSGRIRHGLRAGSLPPGCSYIKRSIAEFRKSLEATVLDARQEIDLVSAATIQTSARIRTYRLPLAVYVTACEKRALGALSDGKVRVASRMCW